MSDPNEILDNDCHICERSGDEPSFFSVQKCEGCGKPACDHHVESWQSWMCFDCCDDCAGRPRGMWEHVGDG